MNTKTILVSFDVDSLLTNVPVEKTLPIIKQRLIPLGLQEDSLWNENIYEQKRGATIHLILYFRRPFDLFEDTSSAVLPVF